MIIINYEKYNYYYIYYIIMKNINTILFKIKYINYIPYY